MQKNKKALSEIVGYTILIALALTMAVLVYAYLKVFIPGETLDCPNDINLIVTDASCSINQGLTLTIANKGLFSTEGMFIRLGSKTDKVRSNISAGAIALPLAPNQAFTLPAYDIDSTKVSVGENVIEVQPFVEEKGRRIICQNDIITSTISCTA